MPDAVQEVTKVAKRLRGARGLQRLAVQIGPAFGGQFERERYPSQSPRHDRAAGQYRGPPLAVATVQCLREMPVQQYVRLDQTTGIDQQLHLAVVPQVSARLVAFLLAQTVLETCCGVNADAVGNITVCCRPERRTVSIARQDRPLKRKRRQI